MARRAYSLRDLLAQVNAIAPGRDKAADGWVGDAAHSARTSDHNADRLGIVRAQDLTDDPRGGLDALWLREALRASRDPRLKYVISEGQIFFTYVYQGHAPWTWLPYRGPNGHFQHVHVSVLPGDVGDRAGFWNLSRDLAAPVRPGTEVKPKPAPPPPVLEEDPMPVVFIAKNRAHAFRWADGTFIGVSEEEARNMLAWLKQPNAVWITATTWDALDARSKALGGH